ncbi:uncharacterized protein J3R85_013305 [Psidium guajava]|nr:uncharacterized protein J3R85_013305 [Psidium guajava]
MFKSTFQSGFFLHFVQPWVIPLGFGSLVSQSSFRLLCCFCTENVYELVGFCRSKPLQLVAFDAACYVQLVPRRDSVIASFYVNHCAVSLFSYVLWGVGHSLEIIVMTVRCSMATVLALAALVNGHVKRPQDEDIRSNVLEIVGSTIQSTYITCPADPAAALGIELPFLVMIVMNLKEYFTFEILVPDHKNVRRRFRASNFQIMQYGHRWKFEADRSAVSVVLTTLCDHNAGGGETFKRKVMDLSISGCVFNAMARELLVTEPPIQDHVSCELYNLPLSSCRLIARTDITVDGGD